MTTKNKKKVTKKPVKKQAKPTKGKVVKKKKPANVKAQPEVSYLFTDQSVTVNFKDTNGYKTKTFANTTPEYTEVKQAIVNNKLDELPSIVHGAQQKLEKAFEKFPERYLKTENGVVFIGGKEVPPDLSKRILQYAEANLPYAPLVKFWRNLQKNPSYRAVQGLFRFLSANHFPITSDGCFVGYKGVRADFTDCHTGKMDNSVGKVVRMPRNMVNEDPTQLCSYGLHVGSYHLAHGTYGGSVRGVTLEVVVNPKDVVAVPYYETDEKMRVCEYKVVGVSEGERQEHLTEHQGTSSDTDRVEEDEHDDDWDDWDDQNGEDEEYNQEPNWS